MDFMMVILLFLLLLSLVDDETNDDVVDEDEDGGINPEMKLSETSRDVNPGNTSTSNRYEKSSPSKKLKDKSKLMI